MTWQPEQISGASCALVGADIGLGSGASIPTWTDRIGPYSFTDQGVSAKRPTYDLTTLGGQPSARFTAASSEILRYAGSMTNASSGSVFAVVRFNSFSGLPGTWASADEASNGSYLRGHTSSTQQIRVTSISGGTQHAVRGGTTLTTGVNYLLEWTSNGSLYAMRVNNGVETLTVLSTSNNGAWFSTQTGRDNVTIGGFKDLAGEFDFFDGWIAAVIFVTGAITTLDRERLNYWVQTTYGISLGAFNPDVSATDSAPATDSASGIAGKARATTDSAPAFDHDPAGRLGLDSAPATDDASAPRFRFRSVSDDAQAIDYDATFVVEQQALAVHLPDHPGVAIPGLLALGNQAHASRQGGLLIGTYAGPRVKIDVLSTADPATVIETMTGSWGRTFLDEKIGEGQFAFNLQNKLPDPDNPSSAPLIANPYLAAASKRRLARFSLDGEPVYQGYVTRKQRKGRDPSGRAAEFTTVSGSRVGAYFGTAKLYPTNMAIRGGLLTGNLPLQDTQQFNYTHNDYDMDFWPYPVEVARQDLQAPIGQLWIGQPPGWPDPSAMWIAPQGTAIDPDQGVSGTWYARGLMALATTESYTIYYALDDLGSVYMDGVKLGDVDGWARLQKTQMVLSSGFHNPSAVITNLTTVTGLLMTIIRDSDGTVVFNTANNGFWKVLPYPPAEPGMTCGHVLQIMYLLARSRGKFPTLGFGFDGYVDSHGMSWPVVSDITLKIGDPYDKLCEQLGESFMDYRWRPNGIILDAYVKGTMGRSSGVVYSISGPATTNLTGLDDDEQVEVCNSVLVRWAQGQFELTLPGITDDDKVEGYLELGQVDSLDEAVALGWQYLGFADADQLTRSADIYPRGRSDTPYQGLRIADFATLDDGETSLEQELVSNTLVQDDKSGVVSWKYEWENQYQLLEERFRSWLQRVAPGGAGGMVRMPSAASPSDPSPTIARTRTYAFGFPEGTTGDSVGPVPSDVAATVREIIIARKGTTGTVSASLLVDGVSVGSVTASSVDTAKAPIVPPVSVLAFSNRYTVQLDTGDGTKTVVTVVVELAEAV